MAEELDEIYFDDTETEEATETFLSSNINTNIADPDFFTLVRRINNGTINLQPDFQRGYVWDNHKASQKKKISHKSLYYLVGKYINFDHIIDDKHKQEIASYVIQIALLKNFNKLQNRYISGLVFTRF